MKNKTIKATGNSAGKLEGIKPTSDKFRKNGYKCPRCGKFNESSGLCNNGNLQIVCKCGIVYNQRFEVDSLLSNINSLKDRNKEIKEKILKKPQKVSSFSQDKPDYNRQIDGLINNFIKKWISNHFMHLIDNDENDGEILRDNLKEIIQEKDKEFSNKLEQLKKDIDKLFTEYMNFLDDYAFPTELKEKIEKKIEELKQ